MSMIRALSICGVLAAALGACAQPGPTSPGASTGPMVTYQRQITVNLDAPPPQKIVVEHHKTAKPSKSARHRPARPAVSVPTVAKTQAARQSRPVTPREITRKREPVIYKKAGLEGKPITRVRQKLGAPDHIQREGDIMLWTYRVEGCAVHLLVDGDTVKSVTVRKALIHSAAFKADKPCFHRFVSDRLERGREAASLSAR